MIRSKFLVYLILIIAYLDCFNSNDQRTTEIVIRRGEHLPILIPKSLSAFLEERIRRYARKNKIEIEFLAQAIVPDVIPIAPTQKLNITYPNGVKINIGNIIAPKNVKDMPRIINWNYTPYSYYTLCLTDPDAPNRKDPIYGEWHHWLVVNIFEDNVGGGHTLSPYIPPIPCRNSGLHRYVFLVYEQPTRLKFSEAVLTTTSGIRRADFKIHNFAKKYKLGTPVAGNFFFAEYDEYVPTIYKQMGYPADE